VKSVTDDESSGTENAAVTFALVATPAAPSVGVTVVTAGTRGAPDAGLTTASTK
jgi:hypothetical protein